MATRPGMILAKHAPAGYVDIMKQALQLKIGQSLSMTPQMQQAIRMLQLSTLELRTEIQQILETNPFLELEEPETPPSEQSAQDSYEQEEYEQRLFEQADWQSASVSRSSKMSADSGDWMENAYTSEQSLQDHLLWQLELSHLSPKDHVIGAGIIESIDNRGFLEHPLEDLVEGIQSQWNEIRGQLDPATLDLDNTFDRVDSEHYWDEVTLGELKTMLLRIQQFDPPGVGAVNLADSLRLQIEALPETTAFRSSALLLIKNHHDVIASQNIKLLLKQSGLSREEITGALALLRQLEVAPGERCCPTQVDYVIPDVIAYKHNDRWHVALNPEVAPQLRMNSMAQQVNHIKLAGPEQDYVKSNVQEAKWFLKSLQSRHDTLLKIATEIVAKQEAFFEEGEIALKPMILADVAERVEMHESTISRVTTQKFIHTPRGVYELKFFFSSHVSTDDGGECSSKAIRAKIKQLIDQESPQKPLSDNKLAQMLEKEGINVARRTVAKYRELEKIPPSSERKKTF